MQNKIIVKYLFVMYGNEFFIMQDIKQIFHGFAGTRKLMNTFTDIGNRLNMLSE